jgi:hypoxanthine phosphoribosyltransferase
VATGYVEDIARALIGEHELAQRVRAIGREVSSDYAGRDPVLIGILKGTAFFFTDLLREITIPCTTDFLSISSYQAGTAPSGSVRIVKDLDRSIEGRHVLMVEDIIDTGLTLRYVLRNLRARRPASLEVCCLLNKPARRLVDIDLKYCGFDVPDQFVVGYGLDYGQRYRNLPFVGVLREEVYAE